MTTDPPLALEVSLLQALSGLSPDLIQKFIEENFSKNE
jgi:hypothetical protein